MPEEIVETIIELGGTVVEAGVDLAAGTSGRSKTRRYFFGFFVLIALLFIGVWLLS